MLDFYNLQRMIDGRYISVQKHPSAELWIYNYTEKTQYEGLWNNETLQCRGLIMDVDQNIVARPFLKFFNVEQHTGPIPAEPFEVFDKLDGSLGILYYVGDTPQLATRSSFTSEQAIKGTEILRTKYPTASFSPGWTYLFEIIFPSNRIVVDYKGVEDIFLLAAVETATGAEMPYEELQAFSVTSGIPIVQHFDGLTDLARVSEVHRDNAEGFVIRFASGLRLKTKYEEYKRLHRLLTGITARRIWELLSNGQSTSDLLDRVPDEFYTWVKQTVKDLSSRHADIYKRAKDALKEVTDSAVIQTPIVLGETMTLKEVETIERARNRYLSEKFDQYPEIKHIIHMMYQKRQKEDVSRAVWDMIKPPHEVPFRKDEV